MYGRAAQYSKDMHHVASGFCSQAYEFVDLYRPATFRDQVRHTTRRVTGVSCNFELNIDLGRQLCFPRFPTAFQPLELLDSM